MMTIFSDGGKAEELLRRVDFATLEAQILGSPVQGISKEQAQVLRDVKAGKVDLHRSLIPRISRVKGAPEEAIRYFERKFLVTVNFKDPYFGKYALTPKGERVLMEIEQG